jgi:hypothetical protein
LRAQVDLSFWLSVATPTSKRRLKRSTGLRERKAAFDALARGARRIATAEGTLVLVSGDVSSRSVVRSRALAGCDARCSDHPTARSHAGDSGVEKLAEEGHFPSRRQAVTSPRVTLKTGRARRRILRSVFSPLGSVVSQETRSVLTGTENPGFFRSKSMSSQNGTSARSSAKQALKPLRVERDCGLFSSREFDVHRACSHIVVLQKFAGGIAGSK